MKLNVTFFQQAPSSLIRTKFDVPLTHAVFVEAATGKGQVQRWKRV